MLDALDGPHRRTCLTELKHKVSQRSLSNSCKAVTVLIQAVVWQGRRLLSCLLRSDLSVVNAKTNFCSSIKSDLSIATITGGYRSSFHLAPDRCQEPERSLRASCHDRIRPPFPSNTLPGKTRRRQGSNRIAANASQVGLSHAGMIFGL